MTLENILGSLSKYLVQSDFYAYLANPAKRGGGSLESEIPRYLEDAFRVSTGNNPEPYTAIIVLSCLAGVGVYLFSYYLLKKYDDGFNRQQRI